MLNHMLNCANERDQMYFYIFRMQAQYADRSRRIFNDLRRANPGMGFPSLYPSETNAATPVQLAQFLGKFLNKNVRIWGVQKFAEYFSTCLQALLFI